jgi:hypothetical protein
MGGKKLVKTNTQMYIALTSMQDDLAHFSVWIVVVQISFEANNIMYAINPRVDQFKKDGVDYRRDRHADPILYL